MRAVKPSAESQPSAAQLAANATNAQHSTGPKTPAGKARVAQNAFKHGFYSQIRWKAATHVGETSVDFDELLGELMDDLDPQDRSERELVSRLAGLTWRLARVHRAMEERLFNRCSVTEEERERGVWPRSLFIGLEETQTLLPMETHLSREISHVQRDLAFSQRYRHARAERAAERDAKREIASHSSMDDVMAALHTESQGLLAASRLKYAASPEPEEPEEDLVNAEDSDGADAVETEGVNAHGSTLNQPLSPEFEEQTQSEASETPPKAGDGSIDLT